MTHKTHKSLNVNVAPEQCTVVIYKPHLHTKQSQNIQLKLNFFFFFSQDNLTVSIIYYLLFCFLTAGVLASIDPLSNCLC